MSFYNLTIRLLFGLSLLITFAAQTTADVVVSVNPPFSDPPFAVSPGFTVSYSPATAIDLTVPSGFPQPNTDVEDDNKFGVGLNYGGTGHTVLTLRHIYEDSPEIALTVGALDVGQSYEVYVQTFVNAGSDFYGGRYGFTSGSLTAYFHSSGGTLIATGDDGPVEQGQFQIREFDLGIHVATGGQLTLYLDDFDGSSLVGDFAALRLSPVPEPGSAILATLGLLAFIAWSGLRSVKHGSSQSAGSE